MSESKRSYGGPVVDLSKPTVRNAPVADRWQPPSGVNVEQRCAGGPVPQPQPQPRPAEPNGT
jgi:hypothetical protein